MSRSTKQTQGAAGLILPSRCSPATFAEPGFFEQKEHAAALDERTRTLVISLRHRRLAAFSFN